MQYRLRAGFCYHIQISRQDTFIRIMEKTGVTTLTECVSKCRNGSKTISDGIGESNCTVSIS